MSVSVPYGASDSASVGKAKHLHSLETGGKEAGHYLQVQQSICTGAVHVAGCAASA